MPKALFIFSMLLSGSAALIYEMVWVRRLGDLLGQDVYAITIVLTVFFAGLGVGGWVFGRLADRLDGRIALYVVLELVIAASALAFDPAMMLLDRLCTAWSPAELTWQLSLAVKGSASFLILVVPALAMGGTLPAISRHVISEDRRIAGEFGWLYGANTLGAAAGVLVSTFVMIPYIGVGMTMRLAVAFNVIAATVAWRASRRATSAPARRPPQAVVTRETGHRVPLLIALATGFVSVGFEILWTRGLSARFVSGVYSFSIILFVYLLCIALGSLLVNVIDRRGWVTPTTCGVLLAIAGLTGLISPALMDHIPQTKELLYQSGSVSFVGFEFRQFIYAVSVMALSLLMFGLVLPMVVRLATRDVARIGSSSGAVYLVNSMGAVIAPLLIGFVVMPTFGLTYSFLLLGALLLLLSTFVVLPWAMRSWRRAARAVIVIAPASAVCAAIGITPDIRAWRSHDAATLVDYREGVAAAVSVVDDPERGLILQANLGYTLGGKDGFFSQWRQGLWPCLVQPSAESVLVLGLGTGCTAGAVYEATDARIDALEIIPAVFDMLHHFDDVNFSLLSRAAEDSNLRVLSVDARHFVRSTDRRYDIVIGDLFEPWRRGVGTMYTREHFEAVANVLSRRGTFWQWLPLYQLAETELRTIGRTFCDVFDHVEVWWLEFNAHHPAIALVGATQPRKIHRIDLQRIAASGNSSQLWKRAGLVDLGPILGSWICGRDRFLAFAGDGPINTLDRPLIEFNAPRSLANRASEWSLENIHRMLALAESAEKGFAAVFPENSLRELAKRYRPAVELMMIAHEHKLQGRLSMATDTALHALAQTPEWSYPIGFCNLMLKNSLKQRDDQQFDRLLARLSAQPSVNYWTEYWRARRAMRDQQPFVAQEHLLKAIQAQPQHVPSVNLLRDLERRFGRRVQDGRK